MNSERRHSFRKVPGAPAYIQLSLDNSGELLNLSEQGLSFRAAAPVYREGPIFCWFSFDTMDRIEATAELAWLDEARKVGGLRFTAITDQTHKRIEEWVGHSLRPEIAFDRPSWPASGNAAPPMAPARRSFVSAASAHVSFADPAPDTSRLSVASGQEPGRIANWRRESSAPELAYDQPASAFAPMNSSLDSMQREPEPFIPRPAEGGVSAAPRRPRASLFDVPVSVPSFGSQPVRSLGSPAYAGNTTELVPARRHLAVSRWRFISGMLVGVASTALLAVPIFRLRALRPAAIERPDSPVPSTESTTPKTVSEASPSGSVLTPKDRHPSPDDASTHRRKAEPVPAGSSGDPFAYASSGLQRPRTVQSPARLNPNNAHQILGGQSSPAVTQQNMAKPIAVRSRASAAQLWAAFEAGSTTAAITLADRYARGDGVTQNCDQARILLTAASKKGSASAQKKLHELESGACAQP